MHCRPDGRGRHVFARSDCSTPIVLVRGDAPVRFTSPEGAFAVGPFPRTEWVSAETPWLALDADGSGCVEDQSELFGADAQASHGFEKLARLDDNGDGRLDAKDPAYARLSLWSDRDQDRRCTPAEMRPLADAGVTAIDLGFRTPATRGAGSYEGETASVTTLAGPGDRRARLVDVYLAPLAPVAPAARPGDRQSGAR